MRLSEVMAIPRGITAVVGGGGKTSLIWRLAQELSEGARVLIATTTHIRPPTCETLVRPTPELLRTAFGSTNLLAAGDPAEGGKLAEAQALRGAYESLADYVLIEADGSRGLPLKAPAAHEPVLPDRTSLVLAVAGMACAGQTIREAAHRPALYAALCGLPEDAPVTPEAVACVLANRQGQRKGVQSRFMVVLNQADTPLRLAFARNVAAEVDADVFITALLADPDMVERWHGGKRVGRR